MLLWLRWKASLLFLSFLFPFFSELTKQENPPHYTVKHNTKPEKTKESQWIWSQFWMQVVTTVAWTGAENEDTVTVAQVGSGKLNFRGAALLTAWAVIRNSWVGTYPTSIISLKSVIMKVLLWLEVSLITMIKSHIHKSQDVILIIIIFFGKMVLRIIYAINFYQHHKSKYTQTGWECE